MENNILTIWLWNQEVGRIYLDEPSRRSVFAYLPDFLRDNIDIAPLLASIHSPLAQQPIVGSREKYIRGFLRFWQILCLIIGGISSWLQILPQKRHKEDVCNS